ncbi:MAG: HAMP domain-containing histidine kinase [Clostridiales bacterium]|nr:HAMP domain-containing histidine kinase [Clostridiales bacterium]
MAKTEKRSSLLKKYFLILTFTIFICFTILGFSLMALILSYWNEQKSVQLMENAETVAQTATEWITASNDIFSNVDEKYFMLCDTLKIVSKAIDSDIFICDADGDVIVCKDLALSKKEYLSDSDSCPIHGSIQIPQKFLINCANSGSHIESTNLNGIYEKAHLVACKPIIQNGTPVAYVMAVEASTQSVTPVMAHLFKLFLYSALLSLCIAFIFVYIFTYRLVNPLREMSKATRAFSDGDFTYRVTVSGNDEMSDLAHAFNSMADALGKLETSRRSFVANVSHELKTPMTTIGGFIDGILDGTIPPEKESYYLDIVSKEVRRLSRLVMAMLNMSKIEAGELKLKPTTFDLSKRIFDVFLSFERNIAAKNIDIQGLDKMNSVFVEADEDMIHQVVYNLVDNAVKFTPNDGVISVSAITDNEKVIVRIKNTGEGIESEELGRVFERFYKVDKSRSFDVKGAGLGLYIIKSIIELHSGQITVKSEVGKYTEFVFWLPVKYGDMF